MEDSLAVHRLVDHSLETGHTVVLAVGSQGRGKHSLEDIDCMDLTSWIGDYQVLVCMQSSRCYTEGNGRLPKIVCGNTTLYDEALLCVST